MEDEKSGPCGTQGFQWENLNKKRLLEEPDIDAMSMLKFILNNKKRRRGIYSFGSAIGPLWIR